MVMMNKKPEFSLEWVGKFIKKTYDISGSITPLPSERDQNFLLLSETGGKYTVKIANASESLEFLEAENMAMSILNTNTRYATDIVNNYAKNF
jgi:Ser/Thr protein kinase RdoA (MazF antagonist)